MQAGCADTQCGDRMPAALSSAALMPGLAQEGRLVLLGIGKDPLAVSMDHLVGGERGFVGSITGSHFENERTLGFNVPTGVRPI